MSTKDLIYRILGEDVSASKAMGDVASAGENMSARVQTGFGKISEGFGGVLKGALLAGGAFAVLDAGKEIISGSIDAASKQQAAQVNLDQAVKNTGASLESVAGRSEATSKALASLGFKSSDTTTVLAQMTTGLRDPQKALDLVGLAADVAAARHISLADAGLLVTKASEGNSRALKQAGIDLPIVATNAVKTQAAQEGLAAAQDKVNQVLAKFPDAADPASKAHAKYQTAADAVAKAQDKVNDALSAGPGLVAGLTTAYGGQAAVSADSFSGKQAVLAAKFEEIQVKLGGLLIGPMSDLTTWLSGPGITYMSDFITGWNDSSTAMGAAGTVAQGLRGIFDFLGGSIKFASDRLNDLINFAQTWSGAGIVKGLQDSNWQTQMNVLQDKNAQLRNNSMAASSPTFNGPRLAEGGVTNGPMLALIGDNPGGREIVQPLDKYKADLQRERDIGSNAQGGGLRIDNFWATPSQSPAEIAANLGWIQRWAT